MSHVEDDPEYRGSLAPADPCIEPPAAIDGLADEVAMLIRGSELRCAFEVGRLVTERLFAGEPGAWHRPGPKARSLARLVERLRDRGIRSASTLSRCLATFEVLESCRDIATSQCLTPSHIHAVLALPHDEQVQLLREADAGRWTVERLEQRARRAPGHSGRGRPRQPSFVRAVREIVRALEEDGLAFRDLDQVDQIDPAIVAELHTGVARSRERFELLQRQLSPKRAADRRGEPTEGDARPGSAEAPPRLRRVE